MINGGPVELAAKTSDELVVVYECCMHFTALVYCPKCLGQLLKLD
jgi:hypothetical protein